MVDYLRYVELTSSYQVSQDEVDVLSREINRNWWDRNKDKYVVES
jgi:hypothetical protein